MVSPKETMRVPFCSTVLWIALLFMVTIAGLGNAKAATTHYIAANGSDSNNGTGKTTAWAHLPGMRSCVGNCSSYTPISGDTFILRGCDVWINSDLPVGWDWSGTASSPITIGVDKTWYNTTSCPSGWNRPIFDAQKSAMAVTWGHGNSLFIASLNSSTSYVTVDNIEFKGMHGSGATYIEAYNLTAHWILSNLYLHAWDMAADDCITVQFKSGNLFTGGVIDGSDSTGAAAKQSCYGFYSTPPDVTNSVIHDLVNPIVGFAGPTVTTVTWSGNHLYNVHDSYQGANHCNIMEIVGGGTYYVHDNTMHDITCAGGEVLMLGNTGETSYVWNNVMYNMNGAQAPNFPQTSNQSGINGLYFWNNTITPQAGSPCFYYSGQSSGSINTLKIQNNHCITTAGSIYGTGATVANLTTTPNTLMTPSVAASQGYTSSETYVYSPISGSNTTVGAGINLSSQCTGNNAGLCNDTAYACIQKTVNGVVQAVCPARTVSARSGSGAWDAGAYQFVGISSGSVVPPTGLTALVQ
jgi:hypothetical protein